MFKPVIKRPFSIKIALLYILEKYGLPIKDCDLNEAAIGVCDINYFNMRHCLDELMTASYISCETHQGDVCYALTDSGRQALGFFTSRLPLAARQSITEHIRTLKLKESRRSEFECTIIPADDLEYLVKVVYREDKATQLDISFRAGSRRQAEQLCSHIANRREDFYGGIMGLIASAAQSTESADGES